MQREEIAMESKYKWSNTRIRCFAALLVWVPLLLCANIEVGAATIEVNPSNINTGLAAAKPGDIVLLRGGAYSQIAPASSGAKGSPIIIRAYPGETPIVGNSASGIGISMDKKAHIRIEGLTIKNVEGFGHIYDSENITIQNCSFSDSKSSGTTGSLKFVRSKFCKVLNSSFSDGGSDMLILQDASDRNQIEGNTFETARHSLVSIRCSEYNVVRNCRFGNPKQKAVEIYDCEGMSDAPVRLNSTKRNLFEGNAFTETAFSSSDYKYNAIQHGGQFTIVRNNVFSNCLGGGVNYQYYSDESLYVYGNRLYNNTFYGNRCYAMMGNSGSSSQYYDNRMTNNLLYKNGNCSGSGDQVRIANTSLVVLSNNALATQAPGFANEAGNDFHLSDGSPYVDAGVFTTKAKSDGSGTAFPVDDVGYFYDGYKMESEAGDLIQLEGEGGRARIVSIDYGTNTLTVDRVLSWKKGQGVHLAYAGKKPDVGAFEFELESTVRLLPPKNLKIQQ
jgi:hypothetical protein